MVGGARPGETASLEQRQRGGDSRRHAVAESDQLVGGWPEVGGRLREGEEVGAGWRQGTPRTLRQPVRPLSDGRKMNEIQRKTWPEEPRQGLFLFF